MKNETNGTMSYLWVLKRKGTQTYLTNDVDREKEEFVHVKDPAKARLFLTRKLCREEIGRKHEGSLYTPVRLVVYCDNF